MLLKVDKLPIITKGKGIVGNLEGLVFKDKSISSIYCKIGDVFYHIPIEEVVIGKDAIIINEQYIEKVINICDLMEVFTVDGDRVGTLQHIELNEGYTLQSLTVDNLNISLENVGNIDSSIIVDLTPPIEPIEEMEEAEEQLNEIAVAEEEEQELEAEIEVVTSDGLDDIEKLEDNEHSNEEIEIEDVVEDHEELSLEFNEDIDILEKQECVLNTPIEITSIKSDILSKYDYLHNKRLEETILISNERFTKGSVISQGLIEKAVSNNEIVKLVMAAEE